MIQIIRNNKDGFVFYSTVVQGNELFAFSMYDIVMDLYNIYTIDLRKHLFNFDNHLN